MRIVHSNVGPSGVQTGGGYLAGVCEGTGVHAPSCHLNHLVLRQAGSGLWHIALPLSHSTLSILIASPGICLARVGHCQTMPSPTGCLDYIHTFQSSYASGLLLISPAGTLTQMYRQMKLPENCTSINLGLQTSQCIPVAMP